MTGSRMSGAETSGPRDPAGRPEAGKKVSDLPKRLVSALVLGTVTVLVTWWGGVSFALLWAAAGTVFAFEWFGLVAPRSATDNSSTDGLGTSEKQFNALPVLRLAIAMGIGTLPALAGLGAPLAAMLGAAIATVLASVIWVLIVRRSLSITSDGHWQQSFGSKITLWVMAGLVLGSAVGLVPVYARATPDIGLTLIAWMFAVVWTTDIAAYFSGRAIGGTKLWPRVSPNKTWSGAIGGTLAAMLMGWLIAEVAANAGHAIPWSATSVLAASLLASIAGQVGDLAESALKRRAGVKDSGALIPGHGGVMDRLDGFVVVCLLVAIGLVVGF